MDQQTVEMVKEIASRVEKLVKPYKEESSIKRTLLSSLGAQNQKLLPVGSCFGAFLGDFRSREKVETLKGLKSLVNEISELQEVSTYCAEDASCVTLIKGRIPRNFVGKCCEIRVKDLKNLDSVRFYRGLDGLVALRSPLPGFYTDQAFGKLSAIQTTQIYGFVFFKICRATGYLIDWYIGAHPCEAPVADLEHEYVTLQDKGGK